MKYALSNVNKIQKAKPSLEWCERVSPEKEVFSRSCCYKSIKMCIQHTIFLCFHLSSIIVFHLSAIIDCHHPIHNLLSRRLKIFDQRSIIIDDRHTTS